MTGAAAFGFSFCTRTPSHVHVRALGDTLRYQLLHVLDFTSARKRMSVIVRTPEGAPPHSANYFRNQFIFVLQYFIKRLSLLY